MYNHILPNGAGKQGRHGTGTCCQSSVDRGQGGDLPTTGTTNIQCGTRIEPVPTKPQAESAEKLCKYNGVQRGRKHEYL